MGKIETKVLAATLGSGLGAATGTLLLWFLGVVVWHQPYTADAATKAVGAVPEPLGAWLVLIIGALSAFLSGYSAPHTLRPDLTQSPTADAADTAPSPAPVVETAPPVVTPAEPEAPAAGVPPAADANQPA